MAQLWSNPQRGFVLMRGAIVASLLLILIAAVFGTTVSHELVNWDDTGIFPDFLTDHGFTRRSVAWITMLDGGDWQPLSRGFFLLLGSLGADSAPGIHTASLIIHVINAILLFFVVLELFKLKTPSIDGSAAGGAFLAVCLVMIHPLRVEAVAWASALSTLLSASFSLCSLLCFCALLSARDSTKTIYGMLVILFVFAALLTKPVSLPLVVWLGLLAWYAAPQPSSRALDADGLQADPQKAEGNNAATSVTMTPIVMVTVALSWGLALGMFAMTTFMRHKFQGLPQAKLLDFSDILPRVAYAFGFYLDKTLLPADLLPFHGFPKKPDAWLMMAGWGMFIFGVLLWLCRRSKGCLLLLCAFVLGLAPALGFLKLGRFVVADRYTYFPSLALAPLLAAVLSVQLRKKSRLSRPLSLVAVAGILVWYATYSAQQTAMWRDSVSLWRGALDHGGGAFADVHSNYGGALEGVGRYQEALAHYDRALELDPLFPDAHIGRGVVLYRLGLVDEAIEEARKAVLYGGDYVVAWQNLVAFLVTKQNFAEARDALPKALSLAPQSPQLLYIKAQLEAQSGRYDEALNTFRSVTELKPDWPDPQIAVGALQALLGRKAEAQAILEKVLQDHPDSTAAQLTLNAVMGSKAQAPNSARPSADGVSPKGP